MYIGGVEACDAVARGGNPAGIDVVADCRPEIDYSAFQALPAAMYVRMHAHASHSGCAIWEGFGPQQ